MKNLLLSLIALAFSFNLVVVFPVEVQAESGDETTSVCQDDLSGAIFLVPQSGECPVSYTLRSVTGKIKFSSLCVGIASPYAVTAPTRGGDVGGVLTCSTTPPSKLTTPGPAPGTPNPSPKPNPNPSPKPNPKPNPNPSPNPNPNPSPSSGTCGPEFEAKGPLCIPKNPFSGSSGIAGSGSLSSLATSIISILLGLAGIIAVIFLIIGGYYWMTARGNETQVVSARKTVINALIGLVIVVLSYMIVQIVTNFITKGS